MGESRRVRRHCGGLSLSRDFLHLTDGPDDECGYLVRDIGSCVADVAVHLAHDADVLVAVQQRVFFISYHTWPASSCWPRRAVVRRLVGLETGVGQNDNQASRVLVRRRDGDMLGSDELGERWRGKRLGSF